MNSGTTQNDPSQISDKVFTLTNGFSQTTGKLLFKTDFEKITAAKIEGDIDSIQIVNVELEKNNWNVGLSLLQLKKTPYPFHLQLAYVQTIEKLLSTELVVPPRALYLRTILVEFERIIHHLEILLSLINSISYAIMYSQIIDLKIKIEKIIEKHFSQNGNNIITFGGINCNFDNDNASNLVTSISDLNKRVEKIQKSLNRNQIFKKQLSDVGFLSRETAKKLSLVGPIARSSGISEDVRKSDSYAAYSHAYFTIPVYDSCDLFGEIMVRIDEVIESFSIIEQLLEKLPNGSTFSSTDSLAIPAKNVVSRIETPSGEMFCFAISKSGTLETIPRIYRITSPLKINKQGILARLTGEAIENIPLILASIGEGLTIQ